MQPPIHIYPDGRMDAKNAALYIGMSVKTMAQWRYLNKEDGPQFFKPSGNRVFYFKADLDAWINRFGACSSTTEAQIKRLQNIIKKED